MPNDSIDDAMKEVYALAPSDRLTLATLQLSHSSLSESIYMVQDKVSHDFTLEDNADGGAGETVTFEPVPFRFTQPTSGDSGLQELSLSIDNVDRRIFDFIESIDGDSNEAVEVTYRPYISDIPERPQVDPPLLLFLTDIVINAFEVSGRATFSNIINLKYPTDYYDRARFPGLGG